MSEARLSAGVVHERTDDLGVATAVCAAYVLVHDLVQIVRPEAPALQQLGVVGADVIAAVDDLAVIVLFDDGHLRTGLGCRKCRLGAGVTAADHHDIEVACLGDGIGRHFGGLSQPVLVAHVIVGARGGARSTQLTLGGSGRGGRLGLGGAAGQAHHAQHAGGTGAGEEVPTRQFHDSLSLSIDYRNRRLDVSVGPRAPSWQAQQIVSIRKSVDISPADGDGRLNAFTYFGG